MWAVLPQTSILTMEAAFTFTKSAALVTSTEGKHPTEETSITKHRETIKSVTIIQYMLELRFS
jgi:Trk-type K+ transport system membrane component